MASEHDVYIVPPSHWPIVGSVAIFCIAFGFAHWLHHIHWGAYLSAFGFCLLIYMLFGWFGQVIRESLSGLQDDPQIGQSFR